MAYSFDQFMSQSHRIEAASAAGLMAMMRPMVAGLALAFFAVMALASHLEPAIALAAARGASLASLAAMFFGIGKASRRMRAAWISPTRVDGMDWEDGLRLEGMKAFGDAQWGALALVWAYDIVSLAA